MLWSVQMSIVGCLCVLMMASCCCDPVIDSEVVVRPTRPKNFASPGELRVYLDQLGQYYAVVGRPRFGKRTEVRGHLPPGYLYLYPQLTESSPSDNANIIYYQPSRQE